MAKSRNIFLIIGNVAAFALMIVLGALVFNALFDLITGKSYDDTAETVNTSQSSSSKHTPKLTVKSVVENMDHPWEIAFLPDGSMLVSERSGTIFYVSSGAKSSLGSPDDVVARGEGGMMGVAVDPQFTSNQFVYACFNSSLDSLDIRVARWKLDTTSKKLSERQDIVTGMPSASSGRHSGCRIGFGPDKNLWIGTGDAAQGANPQDLKSLGGKILRVTRDGKPATGNLGGQADPRIYSYGHRNVQGLAFYHSPQNGSFGISMEHGPSLNDEANELKQGNFGWAPGLPYDENVPMTDTSRFPDAIPSVWSSGNPTIATADADFLRGEKWGAWNGRLAVGILKGQHVRLLEIKDGKTTEQLRLFDGEYGRIRAVTMGSDGSLYISTDNGMNDKVLKITPSL